MRLVACDLDGTVVRPDQTISERTLRALAACLLSIGIALCHGTGTIKERILSAFNGMHSMVASFFALALPGGLVGFVSSLADLLNMPAVSGAMATLLDPKAIAVYTIAAAVRAHFLDN